MQLQIDFNGKKTERITFAASEELKHTLTTLAKATDKDLSKMVAEYVAECAARDLGKLMILQAREKVSINMAAL